MSELPLHIDRRGFLITSGLAGAGIAFGSPQLFAQTLPPLAIGYWEGSDALTPAALKGKDDVSDDAPPLPVATTAALGLLHPDPSFMKASARVRVLPRIRGGSRLTPFSVWVHYQADGIASERLAPFGAWSFDGRGQASSPISFVAPVEQDHGILFSVRSEQSAGRRRAVSAGGVREQFFRFVILPQANEPKLQRGVYFLAPLPGSSFTPNWSSYDYRPDAEGVRRLHSGSRPVDFDYLEIVMEYANPQEDATEG